MRVLGAIGVAGVQLDQSLEVLAFDMRVRIAGGGEDGLRIIVH